VCTVQPNCISNVKNALVKSVHYVTVNTTCSLFTESMQYALDIHSELNCIFQKWNTKYQLHVSAIILAMIRLYSTL
jgi:transposase